MVRRSLVMLVLLGCALSACALESSPAAPLELPLFADGTDASDVPAPALDAEDAEAPAPDAPDAEDAEAPAPDAPDVVPTDACASAPCGPDATCEDIGGVARCTCRPGFVASEGAAGCVDRDECAPPAAPCGAGRCENLPGIWSCDCPAGSSLVTAATGPTCEDIDLCALIPGLCGAGTCSDTGGPHSCACPPDTDFDGVTCVPRLTADPCDPRLEDPEASGFARGRGTAEAPFGLCTAAQLLAVASWL